MFRNWPKYDSYEDVHCYNCNASLWNERHTDDGHAPGHGQFHKFCPHCKAFTWYDIRGDK